MYIDIYVLIYVYIYIYIYIERERCVYCMARRGKVQLRRSISCMCGCVFWMVYAPVCMCKLLNRLSGTSATSKKSYADA